MTGAPLLSVENLSISFRRGGRWATVVRDVSIAIDRGEAYGLVGESGSGKSTVAMAALRYLPRNGRVDRGRILFEGRDLMALSAEDLRALRGVRMAAVYQNPGAALNPALTVGRQIAEIYEVHKRAGRREAREAGEAMLARMRIPESGRVFDLYPHEISGGMQQRVVIGMALALDPALLVLDEPTTALDVTVQAEILRLFRDLRRDFDTALLFISHRLDVVRSVSDRVGILYAGELVEEGPAGAVISRPLHPYTAALVGCIPAFGRSKADGPLSTIDGFPPDPGNRPDGCAFAARCAIARPDCTDRHPALERMTHGRELRCPYAGEAPGSAEVPGGRALAGEGPVLLETRRVDRAFGPVQVLGGISLDIRQGETLGLVGESGSGKSTFAKVVSGLMAPSGGEVRLKNAALPGLVTRRPRAIRKAIQMVFQSPDTTLNPRHSVGWALGRAVTLLGGERGRERAEKVVALLESVRLASRYTGSMPRHLSGGQRQRVAIARAFAGEPELVILDEPTSALDVSAQAAVVNLLVELQAKRSVAYLFISHDLAIVRYIADRIAVLYRGRMVEIGPAANVFAGPNHPYTQMLLASFAEEAASSLPAADRSPAPPGCTFALRCRHANDRCHESAPPVRQAGEAHQIHCWLEPGDPGLNGRSAR
jgi:peptide/nickel transport system ATP-binding protein